MEVRNNLRFYSFVRGCETRMDHLDLYAALGLDPKRHLPDEGKLPQYVGNVLVWVVPRVKGTNQDAKRVWCKCPQCGRELTAGKLFQHLKYCEAV